MARNELGVLYEGNLPFHRVGNRLEDYVTYPQLNRGLKEDGVSRSLDPVDIGSHGLRGGGSCAMNTACGGKILQLKP